MSAVALTDTNNVHGCPELYTACVAEGITPMLGIEIGIASPYQAGVEHPLVLLALNAV